MSAVCKRCDGEVADRSPTVAVFVRTKVIGPGDAVRELDDRIDVYHRKCSPFAFLAIPETDSVAIVQDVNISHDDERLALS